MCNGVKLATRKQYFINQGLVTVHLDLNSPTYTHVESQNTIYYSLNCLFFC